MNELIICPAEMCRIVQNHINAMYENLDEDAPEVVSVEWRESGFAIAIKGEDQ